MRNLKDCLKSSSYSLSSEERELVRSWLDSSNTRMTVDPYRYCCLLGWFILDDSNVALSPKEAGFD